MVGENRRTSRSLALRVSRTNRIIDSSCARLDWAQAVSRQRGCPAATSGDVPLNESGK